MNRVLILGKDGMLGTMVSSYLTSLKDYEIYLTSRRDEDIDLDDNIPGLGLTLTDKYKSDFKIIEKLSFYS